MTLSRLYTKVGGVLRPIAVFRDRVEIVLEETVYESNAEPTIEIEDLTYDESLSDTVPSGVGYENGTVTDSTPTVTIV